MSLWPKVEGDELHSSHFIHMQFCSLIDYAESLILIIFVVFQFWAFHFDS